MKRVAGRKRHLSVDTSGPLLSVWVTAASVSDVLGGKLVLRRAAWPGIVVRRVWVDSTYRGLVDWTRWPSRCAAAVVRRGAGAPGAAPAVGVEPTFAWQGPHRRLTRDDGQASQSNEAFIHIAMTRVLLRRLYPA